MSKIIFSGLERRENDEILRLNEIHEGYIIIIVLTTIHAGEIFANLHCNCYINIY